MNTGTDRRRANWHWKENDVLLEFAPEIGAAAVCVYDVLTMFARNANDGSERVAWPSIERIARILGFTKPTVRQALKKLEDAQLLRVEKRAQDGVNQTNHYTLLDVQDAVEAKKRRCKEDDFFPGSQNFIPPLVKNLDQGSIKNDPGVVKKTIPELYNEEHRQLNNEEDYDEDDDGQPGQPCAENQQMVTVPAQHFQPAIDPEWGAAIGLLQSQLGWMGSGGPTLDEMREFFDNLRDKGLTDWWALAVKVAVDQNARSWAYMRSVLRTALEFNLPPGSPKPQKGNNGNGTYRNGNGKGHPAYDDGHAALSAAQRAELSSQLRASRQAPRLPGV